MKLYATIQSERDSRAGKKGGDEFLKIELSAFGKVIGTIVLEVNDDATGAPMQYLLKFAPLINRDEWINLKEGHQKEGVIQTIKA